MGSPYLPEVEAGRMKVTNLIPPRSPPMRMRSPLSACPAAFEMFTGEATGGGPRPGGKNPRPQSGAGNDHDRDLDHRPHPCSDAAGGDRSAGRPRPAVRRAADPPRRYCHRAARSRIRACPDTVLAASRPPTVRGGAAAGLPVALNSPKAHAGAPPKSRRRRERSSRRRRAPRQR